MAVELLAFPSAASASIHKGGDGELVLGSIQYPSNLTFLGSDLIENGEEKFHREIDRILKTILLKVSPSGRYTSTLVDVVELTVPVVKFPDGDHRCPYFPCPTCHRARSIFGQKGSLSQGSNCKSDTHPALTVTLNGEDEVIALENPSAISNALILNDTTESVVPAVEFPDGGHRCPYIPCPTCHRSRSLFADAESKSNKVSFLNFDCNSDLFTCESEDKLSSHRVCPALIMYPDKGHKCEVFPCPICHKNDRSG